MPFRTAAVVVAVLAVPPAHAGDVAYLAATCTACHAPGAAGAIPGLTGRPVAELAAAIRAFRDGSRSDVVMAAAVTGLGDPDVDALAAHFADATGARP